MHPKLSNFLLWLITIKVIISIFTPLSEDFLTTGIFIAPKSFCSIVSEDGPYLIWMLMVKGMYEVWRILPIEHPPIKSMIGFWYFVPSLSSHTLILILKFPLILFDILCAILLYKIALSFTCSFQKLMLASILWLGNPYILLITEMFGAYDVIIVFFILLSIYYITMNRISLSAISLALSAILKPYPILFFPLYLIWFIKGGKRKGAINFSITFIAVILFAIAPFILLGRSSIINLVDYYIKKGFTFFSGFILRLYVSEVGGWLNLQASLTFIFLFLHLLIYWGLWKSDNNGRGLLDSLLAFCIIIFAFSFWHPQLLLWIMPFLIFDCILHKRGIKHLILFVTLAFSFEFIYFSFYFTSHGNSLFFIPNYNFFLMKVSKILWHFYEYPLLIGPIATIIRSLFIAISMLYLIKLNIQNIDFEALLKTLHGFEPNQMKSSHHCSLQLGNGQE
jgi:hypothetical protein